MKLHHHIVHHVHKHKKGIIAHVNRHHKKYIFGAGLFSGRAITKFIAIMLVFLSISRMGGTTGADYYDVEFYNSRPGNTINISDIIDTENIDTPQDGIITTDISNISGDNKDTHSSHYHE